MSAFKLTPTGELMSFLVGLNLPKGSQADEIRERGIAWLRQAPEDFSAREEDLRARIAAERQRQVGEEGWTAEHDDGHECHELIEAASAYLAAVTSPHLFGPGRGVPPDWPWEDAWWKPSGFPCRNLDKAGALIAAEIDRLERLEARERGGGR